MKKDLYSTSRKMYIIEAGLEYLISILFADAFLATLTSSLGMSDSLTGIISSFISLGCVFQLIAMFLSQGRAKRTVISLSVFNQLLFMFLYVIPLMGGAEKFKNAIFVTCILLAYFIYNIAHPKKNKLAYVPCSRWHPRKIYCHKGDNLPCYGNGILLRNGRGN